MTRFGIVVIGYNRVDSIQRLMKSLFAANYSEDVDLIISIDNSGTDDVERYAKSIVWPHGKKIIKTFPERLGLKRHVLTCGNYINEFGFEALIVLEDDLFVAPDFFNFSKQCVDKYESSGEIAGISLYSHSWNVNADRPFIPIYKGFDVFFMQYPQSWGQVWMKKQWNEFFEWYEAKRYDAVDKDLVPDNVLGWPETSWLKYYVEYCIDAKKYFVYPYHSLATNFADAGTHYAFATNKMQVPLSTGKERLYFLPERLDDSSRYDAYYENEQIEKVVGIGQGDLKVDMYGKKKDMSPYRYLLSTKRKDYKVIESYGLQMRPWELNIIYQVPGKDIFLYDLQVKDKAPMLKHASLIHWVYDTRGEVLLKRNVIDIMLNEVINKFRRK